MQLVMIGVNVNTKDSSKSTASHIAASLGYLDCIHVLADAGANLLIENR